MTYRLCSWSLALSLSLILILLCIGSTAKAQTPSLNLISDRTDFHLKPLLQQFTAASGIQVKSVFVEPGQLVPRILASSDLDLVVATDTVTLVQLQSQQKLKPLSLDPALVAPKYRTQYFTGLSYRVRGIVVKKGFPSPASYMGLANGFKVCVRPLSHPYNLSLIQQLLDDYDYPQVKQWLINLKQNLGTAPTGNDRKQAQLVAQGVCDLGIMNSYYYGLLLANPATRDMALGLDLVYPQGPHGSYTLVSGAALLSANPWAQQLLEFLLSPSSQQFMANVTYEYPVNGQQYLSLAHFPRQRLHLNLQPSLVHRAAAVKLLLELGL